MKLSELKNYETFEYQDDAYVMINKFSCVCIRISPHSEAKKLKCVTLHPDTEVSQVFVTAIETEKVFS